MASMFYIQTHNDKLEIVFGRERVKWFFSKVGYHFIEMSAKICGHALKSILFWLEEKYRRVMGR